MHSIDRRSALKLSALAALAPASLYLAGCAQSASSDEPAVIGGSEDVPPSAQENYTLEGIRDLVVGLNTQVVLEDGTTRQAIGFDNAATTPALQPVLDAVNEELLSYGSIGRGFSQKSDHSTDLYNATRDTVLEFLGADPERYTCVFVNSCTDGLNKLASALAKEDTVVLTTRAEHHANLLPWRERCQVLYAEVDEQGRIIYDEIEEQLAANKVDYVTITAASNVTGYVTDVHRVAKMAHAHGAKIIVDGAQIVAHRAFSMKGASADEDIDFFAFSAHKMYAPFGGGALVGLTEVMDQMQPEFWGGGTVNIVGDDFVAYKPAPAVWEAGSPNYPGVVAMGKAAQILQSVGFDAIQEHEQRLIRKLIDGLLGFDNIIVYGDTEDISDRVGVVTFNFSDLNTHVLAMRLANSFGVATRRGAFCAHPYVWRLMDQTEEDVRGFVECVDVNTAGMIRISFGIYNTEEEVDEFLELLPKAIEMAHEDVNFYSRAEPAY